MIFFDNHTHSNFSPDSKMSIREAIITAKNKNLEGISFTDHLDLDDPYSSNKFFFNPNEQQTEIDSTLEYLKKERILSGNNFKILKGIEVGLQYDSLEKIQNFTKKYKFDVIIASIHFIDKKDPYFGDFFIGKDYKQAYGRTLEVMYKCITTFKDFDILGHFDYVCRYSNYNPCERNITMANFKDYLNPILKFLVQEGKTFEINTKTYMLYKGFKPTFDINILKTFKNLGGEAISLGSDAHNTNRIGENFEYFAQIVKDCGLKYLIYYKNREPQYYKI